MKKKVFFTCISLFISLIIRAQLTDLIIVEFVDWDGGEGFAIKLCNPTPAPIDLSNYYLHTFYDGEVTSRTNAPPFQLSGMLNSTDCIIIGNGGTGNKYFTNCPQAPSSISMTGRIGINREDVVAITFGNNTTNWVDMINRVGNSFSPRIAGTNNATFERKIVRYATNCNRYTSLSGTGPNSWPSNASTNVNNWTVSGKANSAAQCLSAGNFSFQLPTKTESLVTCDSAFINGVWESTSGTYTEIISSTTGCLDTLKTIQLTINPSATSEIQASICNGQSYVFGGQNLSVAGTYFDTIPLTGSACDSIVKLNLTVLTSLVTFDTVRICNGESYLFDGNSLSTTGDYTATISSTHSVCDSIINLRLFVSPVVLQQVNASICANDSMLLGGRFRNSPGIYEDTFKTSLGCDSIIRTTLSITPLLSRSVSLTECQGRTITINGQNYSNSTIVNDTISNVGSCDSVIVYTLNFTPAVVITNSLSFCKGDLVSVTKSPFILTNDTIVSDIQQQVNECDTVFEYQISVDPVLANFAYSTDGLTVNFFNQSNFATSSSWSFGNGTGSSQDDPTVVYTDSGTYLVDLNVINMNGCKDSIRQLIHVVPPQLEQTLYIPNAFTPNNDGVNDYFEVKYINFFDFEILIFNRWGELVFQSKELDFKWNGEINGEEAPGGSYAYIIGGKFKKKGTLTLLR